MEQQTIVIREIKQEDNQVIETIIKSIFPEFNMPLLGTAYEDAETTNMFESYLGEKEAYFVVEIDGIVSGGAGIKPLATFKRKICELQKMYFSPKIRGKGIGKLMINKCLQFAKNAGYEQCYLESATQLEAAIHLYVKNGFKHLEKPLGNTGHYSCSVHMLKNL